MGSSRPKNSFSIRTNVQLWRRPIWRITLYVPVLLFYFGVCLFLFLVWPDLDSEDITVSPHAAICMLFMKKKKARGLITYNYGRVYSHILSVAGVTSSWFLLLLLCEGKNFCTFRCRSPVQAWVLYQHNKSHIQWKLHPRTSCHPCRVKGPRPLLPSLTKVQCFRKALLLLFICVLCCQSVRRIIVSSLQSFRPQWMRRSGLTEFLKCVVSRQKCHSDVVVLMPPEFVFFLFFFCASHPSYTLNL